MRTGGNSADDRGQGMRASSPARAEIALALLLFFAAGCGDGGGNGGGAPTNTIPPNATATSAATVQPTSTIPAPTATRPATSHADGNGELDISICAPDAGPFSADLGNPFFPMPVGAQWVLTGEDDGVPVRVVITSLDATEVVAGVTTRVIEEREWDDGALVEVSRNFFVQTVGRDRVLLRRGRRRLRGGAIVSHDGAWRAGVNGALPGIVIPAPPRSARRSSRRSPSALPKTGGAGRRRQKRHGRARHLHRHHPFHRVEPARQRHQREGLCTRRRAAVDAPIERIPMSLSFCGTLDGTAAHRTANASISRSRHSRTPPTSPIRFSRQPAALGGAPRTRRQ